MSLVERHVGRLVTGLAHLVMTFALAHACAWLYGALDLIDWDWAVWALVLVTLNQGADYFDRSAV